MANSTTMTYGNYTFSPVPLINITKDYTKAGDGTPIGTLFRLTLNGTLVVPSGEAGSIATVDTLQDNLREALSTEGCNFDVMCGTGTLIHANPRINSINFSESNDNWVYTAPYSIEIEFDDEPTASGEDSGLMAPYLQGASEDWSLEFIEDNSYWNLDLTQVVNQEAGYSYERDTGPYSLRLTHNVSAQGKLHYDNCTGEVTPAWHHARDYVVPKLDAFNQSGIGMYEGISGAINLDVTSFDGYNHVRSRQIDELGGSYSVTESWVVINPDSTGVAGKALEDFTVTTQTAVDSPFMSVVIDGSIQGLESVDYGTVSGDYNITESKYEAATGYWNTVGGRLLPRAQLVYEAAGRSRPINIYPLSTNISKNISKGVINYSWEYNDRPTNCISGALSESFVITDAHPTDMFASLTVLGRTAGPVLQDLNTVTAPTRNLAIDILMEPPTGCVTTVADVSGLFAQSPQTQVNVMLCAFEQQLSGEYSSVFRTTNETSWDWKEGRYSRNVAWVYGDCSGNLRSTFC
jgi:hypothetical protein